MGTGIALMTSARSQSELLVLQAVRLAGVANTEAILDRAVLRDADVDSVLDAANIKGMVERFTFGETSGWIITKAGQAHLEGLLQEEAVERGAIKVLERTLDDFDPLNEEFVGLVSSWQLESTSSTTTGFGAGGRAEVDELLTSLTEVGAELREILGELVGIVPRFGRLRHAGIDVPDGFVVPISEFERHHHT